MSLTRRFVLASFPAALLALALTGPVSAAPATRLLFIGNSYTYFNNLPVLVKALAEAAGAGPVEVRMVAPGGWSLADHWEKGDAHDALIGARPDASPSRCASSGPTARRSGRRCARRW